MFKTKQLLRLWISKKIINFALKLSGLIMNGKFWKNALLVILSVIILILLGMSAVIQSDTIIEWWKPVGICGVVSIPIGLLLRNICGRLTGLQNSLINSVAGIIIVFSAALCAFYCLNYYRSDHTTARHYSVEVVNKYSQERYRSKRIGRRTVRGEKYHVYYIVIQLPDGKKKKYERPVGEFSRTRIGKKVPITMEDGLFGIPVIKSRPGKYSKDNK